MSTEWNGVAGSPCVGQGAHNGFVGGRLWCGYCVETCSASSPCARCWGARNEQRLHDIATLVAMASKLKRPPLLVKQVRTILNLYGGFER